jgi:YVTN family beta-propeller protein
VTSPSTPSIPPVLLAAATLLVAAAPALGVATSRTAVQVGSDPIAAAARGRAGEVFVANRTSETVSVINVRTRALVRTIGPVSGTRTVDLAVDVGRDRLWQLESGLDRLFLRDAATGRVLGTVRLPAAETPVAVALEPGQNRVLVASNSSGGGVVHRIDPTSFTVARTRSIPGVLRDLAVSDRLDRAIVAVGSANRVRFLSSSTLADASVSGATTGTDPRGVAVLGDQTADRRLLVTNRGADSVWVIRLDTGARERILQVGPRPGAIAADDVAQRAWVANTASTSVTVIEREAGVLGVRETVGIGQQPVAVAVEPGSLRAVVTTPLTRAAHMLSRYSGLAHSLPFPNRFGLTSVPATIPDMPVVNLAETPFGLSGGMAFAALDHLLAGYVHPREITEAPQTGAIFEYLGDRALDSLSRPLLVADPAGPIGPRFARLQQRSDADSPGTEGLRNLTLREMTAIAPTLDTGRPVPVGVVRAQAGDSPFDNEIVLAVGQFTVGTERVVEAYDPNLPPGAGVGDGITFLWTRQRRQTTNRQGTELVSTFRGLFSAGNAYREEAPPVFTP